MTTTTQTLRRSYSKPALLVIEIDGDALLYDVSGGGSNREDLNARKRGFLYWETEEEDEF